MLEILHAALALGKEIFLSLWFILGVYLQHSHARSTDDVYEKNNEWVSRSWSLWASVGIQDSENGVYERFCKNEQNLFY